MRLRLPAVFLTVSFAVAQTTPPADKNKIRLEGTVVTVTGEVLQKATLTLQRRDGDPPRDAYIESSGNDGKFVFEGVPPGHYSLFARKNGYVTQQYGAQSRSSPDTVFILNDGQEIKGLDIKMTLQSVVTGRVTNSDGEPIADVTVQVLHSDYASGRRQLLSTGSAITNDQGDFRISGLAAGRYYLQATARRPLAIQPAGQEVNITTFYPNGLDALSAAFLDVAAGTELRGIDIRMRRAKVYSLQGTAVDSSTGKPASGASVSIGTNGDQLSFVQSAQVRPDGGFELRNLLPGSYFLYGRRNAAPNAVSSCLTGRLDNVTIADSGIDNKVMMVLRPCLQIAGNIKLDDDLQRPTPQNQAGAAPRSPAPIRGTVGLAPADGLPLGYRAPIRDDGTFVLSSLEFFKYYVDVIGLSESTYVKSVRFGGQDVTHQPLNLSSGADGTLDIVLSSKAAKVSGRVQNEKGEAMAGFTVTLWPKTPDPGRASGGVKRANTDQNGGFRFTGLAPGDYFLAAWEELLPGLTGSAELLTDFADDASPVKLLEGGHESLNLELVPREKIAAELAKIP